MLAYLDSLRKFKHKPGYSISVKKYDGKSIKLRVLTLDDLVDVDLIDKLSGWRRKHSYWFGGQFKISRVRTRKWLKNLVLLKPDRILFIIEDSDGKRYGHLGFNRFRLRDNSCELDNVVRGKNEIAGLMTDCVETIVAWGFKNLAIDSLFLTTFFDNEKAVNLYTRCNFKKIRKIPLIKIEHEGELQWEPVRLGYKGKPQRYYLRMKFKG